MPTPTATTNPKRVESDVSCHQNRAADDRERERGEKHPQRRFRLARHRQPEERQPAREQDAGEKQPPREDLEGIPLAGRRQRRMRASLTGADRESRDAGDDMPIVGEHAPQNRVVALRQAAAHGITTSRPRTTYGGVPSTEPPESPTARIPFSALTTSSKTRRTVRGASLTTAPFAGATRIRFACASATAGTASAAIPTTPTPHAS
jgi:hypothetical protein